MKYDVRVESEQVAAQLRQARLAIDRQVREGLTEAANQAALPHVRIEAPSVISSALVARSTNRGPYITTAGPKIKDRITGLLNYGGTSRAVIAPVTKLAVTPASGVAVSRVSTPRRYTGKRFIEKGIARALPRMADVATRQIMHAFDGLPHD